MSKFILLQGLPASGKGTQARILEDRKGFTHVSCGDVLRGEVKNNSAIGAQISKCIKAGQMLSDREVSSVLLAHLIGRARERWLILEGYPRTLLQLSDFLDFVSKGEHHFGGAIYLDVEFTELIQRIQGRRICASCSRVYNLRSAPPKVANICDLDGGRLIQREDDRAEVAAKRLALYEAAEGPVKDKLASMGQLTIIDGNGPVEEVSKKIEVSVLAI